MVLGRALTRAVGATPRFGYEARPRANGRASREGCDMYDTSDIRKNLKFILDSVPVVVVEFQFVKPGKGQAFTRTKLQGGVCRVKSWR